MRGLVVVTLLRDETSPRPSLLFFPPGRCRVTNGSSILSLHGTLASSPVVVATTAAGAPAPAPAAHSLPDRLTYHPSHYGTTTLVSSRVALCQPLSCNHKRPLDPRCIPYHHLLAGLILLFTLRPCILPLPGTLHLAQSISNPTNPY